MFTFTDVWLLSVPREHLADAENLLRPHDLELRWFTQPANPRTFQSKSSTSSQLPIHELAAELANISLAFELESPQESILYSKALGLKLLHRDESGEFVIRFGQLDEIARVAAGNRQEYDRLLRLARGQAWLDVLEPLRAGSVALEGLRRVG